MVAPMADEWVDELVGQWVDLMAECWDGLKAVLKGPKLGAMKADWTGRYSAEPKVVLLAD
jgi:hypothetical protein